MKLARTLRTLRHLKPAQFVGRLRREVVSRLDSAGPGWWVRRVDAGADVSLRVGWRPQWPALASPAGQPKLADSAPEIFGATLGEALADARFDDVELSPLAVVNLHAFHFVAHDDDPVVVRAVMDAWIARHPPVTQPAWSAWCIARRVPVWLRFLSAHPSDDDAPRLASLGRQVEALSARVESDLQGNHLWDDGVALYMAGLALDGRRANAWRSLGRRILQTALKSQLLPCGGHGERSVMYHAALLAGLLELMAALEAAGEPDMLVAEAAEAMTRWLERALPTGGVDPALNDAMTGLYPSGSEVLHVAWRAGLGSSVLAPRHRDDLDGALVSRFQGHYLLLDAAPIGLNEQPGHAHADTLCMDWRVAGSPVLADPGVVEYVADPHRSWARSSRAHNVLTIEDRDTAEVWHTFRVGRRPSDVQSSGPGRVPVCMGEAWRLEGSHDGYRHLPGAPWVRREVVTWWLDEHNAALWVADEVDGLPAEIRSRMTLAAGVDVAAQTLSGDVTGLWAGFGFDRVRVEEQRVSAGVGAWTPAKVVVGAGRARHSGWVFVVGQRVSMGEVTADASEVEIRWDGAVIATLPSPHLARDQRRWS